MLFCYVFNEVTIILGQLCRYKFSDPQVYRQSMSTYTYDIQSRHSAGCFQLNLALINIIITNATKMLQ